MCRKVMEHLVNVGHVEVAAQGEVARPPVVAAQERMHILQSALAGGGVAQVSHEQRCLLGGGALSDAAEYLSDGILALGTLAEHIFLTGRSVKTYERHAGALLTAVVLFLHHKVELVKAIAASAIFLAVIFQRLKQAYHSHAALMLQLFHLYML